MSDQIYIMMLLCSIIYYSLTAYIHTAMIRPLIVSMYDYRMVFHQQSTLAARNDYKMNCLQSNAFMAAEEVFAKIDQQGIDPEEAIRLWNNSKQEAPESKESIPKADYKSKLDEMFKTNNRSYYRARQQEKPISKEKSEEYRSPSKHESNHSFVPQTQHKYSSSYTHNQRYHSPYTRDSYYDSRYKSNHRY